MKDNKWVRSISFNKNNAKDKERLNLIGRKSFSRYIKKLLDQEIARKKANNETIDEIQEVVEVLEENKEEVLAINNDSIDENEEEKESYQSYQNKYSGYYQAEPPKPLLTKQSKPLQQ